MELDYGTTYLYQRSRGVGADRIVIICILIISAPMCDCLSEDVPTKHKLVSLPQQVPSSQATVTLSSKSQPSQIPAEEFSNITRLDSSSNQSSNVTLTRVIQRLKSCQIANEMYEGWRWAAYELEKHIMILVGPTVMDLEAGAELAVYIPEEYRLKVDPVTNKLVFAVERKITEVGEFIMGYCYFVYEPAEIAYPTLICDWITCYRRNTLKQYFGNNSSQSQEGLVYGNIGHHILEGLGAGIYQDKPFDDILQDAYKKFAHQLYLIEHEFTVYLQRCTRKFKSLFEWFNLYVNRHTEFELIKGQLYCTIDKVAGCEERIRSRLFGFKGIIDMVLSCTLRRGSVNTKTLVPFELKTGEAERSQHVTQVHIYNLMLSEKFKSEGVGLLYYPAVNRLVPILTGPLKVHEALIRRNNVVRNMKQLYSDTNQTLALPKFDHLGEDCKTRCEYYKECLGGWIARRPYSCSTLRDIEDVEQSEQLDIFKVDRFKAGLNQLQGRDKEYLSRWLEMLHLEQRTKKMDLIKLTQKRLNMLQISNFPEFCEKLRAKSGELVLQLRSPMLSVDDYVLLDTSFRSYERVMCHINMIKFSQRLLIQSTNHDSKNRIARFTLKVDGSRADFNEQIIQYVGMLDCKAELEKIEYGVYSQHRSTIVNLVFSDKKRNKLRRVVMDDPDPTFGVNSHIPKYEQFYSSHIRNCKSFNEDQRQSVRKALFMDYFSLIQGMPGTGKTKVIIGLIEILVDLGVKVLVSSYTNSALECILDRVLKETNIDQNKIIRLGTRTGNFSHLYYDRAAYKSVEEVQTYFQSKRVWFVTLTSAQQDHIPSDFGVIIVDEASQCLEPLCISVLEKGKRFVLIGDYQQLQPLVKSPEAAEKGMAVSLFERLCRKYPDVATPLKKQYRMCSEIMALSNSLVYEGMLETADEKTANMRLNPNQQSFARLPQAIRQVIDPQRPIVFINHDKFPLSSKGELQQLQLTLTLGLYRCLLGVGINSTSVISFYNQTSYLLNERLKRQKQAPPVQTSILTVDKSQGIDRDCIIFLVQDGPDQNKLIRDMRRINVSLTRSKCKLIIIGSATHIDKIMGGRLVELIKPNEIALSQQLWMEASGMPF